MRTLIALALILPVPPACAQAVGMITQVKGNVTLVTPRETGKPRPALLADVLYDETEVVAGPGGSATLLDCPRSVSLHVFPRGRVIFSEGNARTVGKVTRTPLKYCYVPQASLARASRQQVGATVVRSLLSELAIVSPRPGTRALPTPTLMWTAEQDASRYTVVLETVEEKPLWRTATASTTTELPADSALAPGETYRLRVTAMRQDEELSSASVVFRVLAPEEARSYAEKIRYFRTLARRAPRDASPHLQLALLYEEVQDYGAAVRAYQAALKLGDSEFVRSRLEALQP